MLTKEKEIELLVMQRNQLVEALANTNATFHKVLFTFFTSLVTIMVAENFKPVDSSVFILFLIQVVVFLIFFIMSLLVTANMQRYYIYAIDLYAKHRLKVDVLFYQGYTAINHTIGLRSFYSFMNDGIGFIAVLVAVWLVVELKLHRHFVNNYFFWVILAVEFVFFCVSLYKNHSNKKPKGSSGKYFGLKVSPIVYECLVYMDGEAFCDHEEIKNP